MKRPLIEACVDSYASAMAASRAGADRLELCAHLVIGGTTPTHALFRQVQRGSGVPINVLIRPRFGDFLYTEPELEEMCEEIAAFPTSARTASSSARSRRTASWTLRRCAA